GAGEGPLRPHETPRDAFHPLTVGLVAGRAEGNVLLLAHGEEPLLFGAEGAGRWPGGAGLPGPACRFDDGGGGSAKLGVAAVREREQPLWRRRQFDRGTASPAPREPAPAAARTHAFEQGQTLRTWSVIFGSP